MVLVINRSVLWHMVLWTLGKTVLLLNKVKVQRYYQVSLGFSLSVDCRIKRSHGAAQLRHGFLKRPVVGDAKRVNEAPPCFDIFIKLVQTNILVTIQSSTVRQPLSTKVFPGSANGLQRHADKSVELVPQYLNRTVFGIQEFVSSDFVFWDNRWNCFRPSVNRIEIRSCSAWKNFVLFLIGPGF